MLSGGNVDVNIRMPFMQPTSLRRHCILPLDERMWQGHAGRQVSVCAIVRTWAGHEHCLGALLTTLAASAHQNVSVHVIDTGRTATFTSLPNIVHEFNSLVGFEMVHISKWTSKNTRHLFPGIGDLEDWGYIATDMLIGDILQWNDEATMAGRAKPCMALYITNGDNIMGKSFFLHTLDAMAKGHNMVATNFIHRMADYQMRGKTSFQKDKDMINSRACGGWRPGSDAEFFTQFRRVCVDLAAVVTNASLWNQPEGSGIRFIINKLIQRSLAPPLSAQQPLAWRSGAAGERLSKLQNQHNSATKNHGERSTQIQRFEFAKEIFTADGVVFQAMAAMKNARPLIIRRALVFHQ
jgi:hypothetical protein